MMNIMNPLADANSRPDREPTARSRASRRSRGRPAILTVAALTVTLLVIQPVAARVQGLGPNRDLGAGDWLTQFQGAESRDGAAVDRADEAEPIVYGLHIALGERAQCLPVLQDYGLLETLHPSCTGPLYDNIDGWIAGITATYAKEVLRGEETIEITISTDQPRDPNGALRIIDKQPLDNCVGCGSFQDLVIVFELQPSLPGDPDYELKEGNIQWFVDPANSSVEVRSTVPQCMNCPLRVDCMDFVEGTNTDPEQPNPLLSKAVILYVPANGKTACPPQDITPAKPYVCMWMWYYWNGCNCVSAAGACGCTGRDCGSKYLTEDACWQAHIECERP